MRRLPRVPLLAAQPADQPHALAKANANVAGTLTPTRENQRVAVLKETSLLR